MNTNLKLPVTVLAFALVTGCASQTKTEREFGNTVRAVSLAQIHDMGAALYPETEAVTGGSPDRLENVVKTHSADADDGSRVRKPLRTGLGTDR